MRRLGALLLLTALSFYQVFYNFGYRHTGNKQNVQRNSVHMPRLRHPTFEIRSLHLHGHARGTLMAPTGSPEIIEKLLYMKPWTLFLQHHNWHQIAIPFYGYVSETREGRYSQKSPTLNSKVERTGCSATRSSRPGALPLSARRSRSTWRSIQLTKVPCGCENISWKSIIVANTASSQPDPKSSTSSSKESQSPEGQVQIQCLPRALAFTNQSILSSEHEKISIAHLDASSGPREERLPSSTSTIRVRACSSLRYRGDPGPTSSCIDTAHTTVRNARLVTTRSTRVSKSKKREEHLAFRVTADSRCTSACHRASSVSAWLCCVCRKAAVMLRWGSSVLAETKIGQEIREARQPQVHRTVSL